MTYSYTQISHYLTCPRRYRHRYLDGLAGKGYSGRHALWACFRTSTGCLLSA
jgi:hypothetical protein